MLVLIRLLGLQEFRRLSLRGTQADLTRTSQIGLRKLQHQYRSKHRLLARIRAPSARSPRDARTVPPQRHLSDPPNRLGTFLCSINSLGFRANCRPMPRYAQGWFSMFVFVSDHVIIGPGVVMRCPSFSGAMPSTRKSCVPLRDEAVDTALKCGRDMWVFTNKRILAVDVKGLSGKRVYNTAVSGGLPSQGDTESVVSELRPFLEVPSGSFGSAPTSRGRRRGFSPRMEPRAFISTWTSGRVCFGPPRGDAPSLSRTPETRSSTPPPP